METTSKVLWGEGLFLRPQHFQLQDAYHEDRLRGTAAVLHPYAWGLRSASFDRDALANGVLRAQELSVVFPDGELYSAPGAEALPPSVMLDALSIQSDNPTFYLALAPVKELGRNYAQEEAGRLETRYVQKNTTANDLFTEAARAEIALLNKSVRLISSQEPRDQLITVPVVRLRRDPNGSSFEIDPTFIAPSVSIAGSPQLFQKLRRLLDILQAKVAALQGFHREPSKNVIEFRSGDVASFWLLHTTNVAFASLSHFLAHPLFHPERLFQTLLELAGSLMTFAKTYALKDLPAYNHSNPEDAFEKLDQIIKELLETVISTRYFSINLTEVRPSYHSGRINSEKIDEQTSFFLSVSADMPALELVDAVPLRFKIGAPDDVEKLVLSAMPGVKLSHAPQVPAAIPVRPGAYYFSVDPRGALYERMLQAQTIMIYVPNGIKDLKLELIAVTQ